MKHRIKEIRKHYNLTQNELGQIIGISNTAVSKIEKGENNLSEQNILFICKELDINEHWLRTGHGSMLRNITESEKIMKYTAMLLKDTESKVAKAIKHFIVTYEQLDDTSKTVLDNVIDNYLDNIKKDPL